ncbi:spondin-2-like isoform X1 [Choristoneura fumiferana]|uniref:spondin-2-like isoform X1 n=1 Tax=Choristoneura fumiferana TaxID=7141 RepID=UPI003D15D31D
MAKKSLEKWLLLLMFLLKKEGSSLRCDRRPYGSTTQASPSDGRYQLNVLGADDTYLPEQAYTVQLTRTDDESEFIAFVVSAEAELKQDPRNPRRLVAQNPGELRPQATGKYSDRCLYSVEQSSYNTKSSVELYWKAPATGRGCVTLRAMVAESQEIWFEDGAPLTVKLCEDMRQPDDVSPNINYECKVCDEAKYEVTFEGSWSRNIHPRLYPESDWLPRFSDLVGASHAADYVLWAPGNLASDGLKDLAEHANTSTLEAEIREKIGDGIRTLIKGKGHGYKKMENPTRAVFRTDNTNHLITVAIALYPSPDWFLGVTRFELCEEDNTWLKEREINLYPWDAGTDSGISYESANIETFPQDAVSRVQISSYDKNSPFYEMDMKDLRPFGRLHIKLIRTYPRECEESSEEEGGAPEVEEKKPEDNGSQEPDEPSRYQYPDIASDGRSSETPLEVDPNATEECPLTPWGEWSRCEGMCENGQLVGYKWRERFHLVDGIAVEKYDPNASPHNKAVPPHCKNKYDDFEQMECEESCAENEDNVEVVAERRRTLITPGHPWGSRKRDLFEHRNAMRALL